jgi:hypothetical protein
MSNSIVEIRDYTIDSERFDAYKERAKNLACPWLNENSYLHLNARFMKVV